MMDLRGILAMPMIGLLQKTSAGKVSLMRNRMPLQPLVGDCVHGTTASGAMSERFKRKTARPNGKKNEVKRILTWTMTKNCAKRKEKELNVQCIIYCVAFENDYPKRK
mmetsp:Transcript_42362/g.78375  ORF Transcript_42362/g.78375 Transcript_42362/m.78375 type:complete len:108 (-) Transcript_42362:245-568(-)